MARTGFQNIQPEVKLLILKNNSLPSFNEILTFHYSFIARLFHDALEESRPNSVLVQSVCISLLDPKRQKAAPGVYNRRPPPGPAKPETVEGMLESLGSLVKLLDVSAEEGEKSVMLTTYGKLQPPLGKIRLKIIKFISVLMTVGGEAAGKELIRLGALKRILELFFEYPYNNLAHHHIERIIDSCLESNNVSLIQHILEDCHLVSKILDAEKNCALYAPPTLPAEGRTPPRVGNAGHMTRIANKLIKEGANNTYIDSYLQGHSEWAEWHTSVLTKRNALENVYRWTCGCVN
ncbi:uncharacterized protein LOC143560613 [Bidens hawaiensis]|uniref:uncharacterized protein LOC143560613 n=1 Tax=Bidens hawaiensis TaxID=980011 RepID=UPI00404AC92E